MSRAPATRRCSATGCRLPIALAAGAEEAALPVAGWLCDAHAAAFWVSGEGRRLAGIRGEPGSAEEAQRLQGRSRAAVGDFVRRLAAEGRDS